MKDASPLLNFDDSNRFTSDTDHMIFGPLEFDDVSYAPDTSYAPFTWDPFTEMDTDIKPIYTPQYDFLAPPTISTDHYDPQGYYGAGEFQSPLFDTDMYLSNWVNDPDMSPSSMGSSSSPIPIPSSASNPNSSSFIPYGEHNHFPQNASFSPAEFAALHPLPRSVSPSTPYDSSPSSYHRQRVESLSISPSDTSSLQPPAWASQLWDNPPSPSSLRASPPVRHSVRHSPLSSDSTQRQRIPIRRESILPVGQIFQSSSAPSLIQSPLTTSMGQSRPYSSKRAESESQSISVTDDRDATVRRKKRPAPADEPGQEKSTNNETCAYIRSPLATSSTDIAIMMIQRP